MARSKHPSIKGSLIIIGGSEDREGEMEILRSVTARLPKNGKLVVATVASTIGDELWQIYRRAFKRLGVKHIHHLDVIERTRQDTKALRAVRNADALFFTGGDQLRITSELGGTGVLDEIFGIYARGGVIAGTSAGASVMSETMLVGGGTVGGSFRIGNELKIAPGLGLVKNMIIDQHFAERGRINRLIGAVAMNPKFLGIGIDEDTGIILEGAREFRVIGEGAVYVIDAHQSTESNISEAQPHVALSIFNVRFHVLRRGDCYDLEKQEPRRGKTVH